jgi:hypothetical protein
MTESVREELSHRVIAFARATEAPEESFLTGRFSLSDADDVQSIIDGLTLSLISYCYHRHPRGENVHELMEKVEAAIPGSREEQELERRADDAAALQIPFVVTLNRLTEEYYTLRKKLEERLQSLGGGA